MTPNNFFVFVLFFHSYYYYQWVFVKFLRLVRRDTTLAKVVTIILYQVYNLGTCKKASKKDISQFYGLTYLHVARTVKCRNFTNMHIYTKMHVAFICSELLVQPKRQQFYIYPEALNLQSGSPSPHPPPNLLGEKF